MSKNLNNISSMITKKKAYSPSSQAAPLIDFFKSLKNSEKSRKNSLKAYSYFNLASHRYR